MIKYNADQISHFLQGRAILVLDGQDIREVVESLTFLTGVEEVGSLTQSSTAFSPEKTVVFRLDISGDVNFIDTL